MFYCQFFPITPPPPKWENVAQKFVHHVTLCLRRRERQVNVGGDPDDDTELEF